MVGNHAVESRLAIVRLVSALVPPVPHSVKEMACTPVDRAWSPRRRAGSKGPGAGSPGAAALSNPQEELADEIPAPHGMVPRTKPIALPKKGK